MYGVKEFELCKGDKITLDVREITSAEHKALMKLEGEEFEAEAERMICNAVGMEPEEVDALPMVDKAMITRWFFQLLRNPTMD